MKEITDRLKREGDLVRNSGTNSIKAIKVRLDDLIEIFRARQLKDEENRRELLDLFKKQQQPDPTPQPSSKPKPSSPAFKLGLASLLGVGAGAIAGLGAVFAGGMMSLFKGFFTQLGKQIPTFTKTFISMSKRLKPFLNFLAKIFKPLLKLFAPLTNAFNWIFKTVSKIIPILTGPNIMMGLAKLKALMSTFGGVLTKFIDGFKVGFGFISKNGGLFKSIMGNIGKLLGKLALPLTILFAGFEAIKGALDGFKEDGILGGIEGAITGLLNGLVGWLVDIPIRLTEWMAEKLGWDNLATSLEDISFKSMLGSLFDFLNNVGEWIGEKIYGIYEYMTEEFSPAKIFSSIKNKLTSVFNFISNIPSLLAALLVNQLPNILGLQDLAKTALEKIGINVADGANMLATYQNNRDNAIAEEQMAGQRAIVFNNQQSAPAPAASTTINQANYNNVAMHDPVSSILQTIH